MMNQRSIGYKIGVTLGLLHLSLVVFAFHSYINSSSSTAGLVFLWFFTLDAPILIFPSSIFKLFGFMAPLFQFGVLGSTLWFLIPWLVDKVLIHILPKVNRTVRGIIIVGTIPLFILGFGPLSLFANKLSMQGERPEELTKSLNSASSDFLTEKVIFEDTGHGGVISINRMSCRPGAGKEILLGLSAGTVFLNDSYEEQKRWKYPDSFFMSLEPIYLNEKDSCRLLAYRFGKYVSLIDLEGKEMWKVTKSKSSSLAPDGATFGDIDGDGRPEFAVQSTYIEGIHMVDELGNTLWKHKNPNFSIGHLEVEDVTGDGKANVIYSNSNNAKGGTYFTFLDSTGDVENQLNISTTSYEFALIRWPKDKLNFLLTEEKIVRIVDLEGNVVLQLEAPGCRPYGAVKAITVKFRENEPAYLAIRKSLHPDIAVLYVYDFSGNLVYQKTDLRKGLFAPALAAVPVKDSKTEKLLVGSKKNYKALVLEYSIQ